MTSRNISSPAEGRGVATDTPVTQAERGLAQFFFEMGFGACYAEAIVRNGNQVPFPLGDAEMERQWAISQEAYDDADELQAMLALARSNSTASSVSGDLAEELRACSGWGGLKMGNPDNVVVSGDLRERILASLANTPAASSVGADERLRLALEPFAAMGRVMETRARVTFGKVPKDSEIVCESSGEAGMGILTMGHFRDAAALLPDAPGWGGIYKPLSREPLTQSKD